MVHRLWMTKDPTAHVEQFSETAEKGIYVFFDPHGWERVRVSVVNCKLEGQPGMLTANVEGDCSRILAPRPQNNRNVSGTQQLSWRGFVERKRDQCLRNEACICRALDDLWIDWWDSSSSRGALMGESFPLDRTQVHT